MTEEIARNDDIGQSENIDSTEYVDQTQESEISNAQADSFFDPQKLPEELKSVYKDMQSAYTKKTQDIAQKRQMIEAYEAFQRDPVNTLRQLNQQYGINVQEKQDQEFNPNAWDDVFSETEKRMIPKLMKELEKRLGPVENIVRGVQRNNLETHFDGVFPGWRQYEDDMVSVINKHPTLVNDPDKLLMASLPRDVYQAHVAREYMEKQRRKLSSAQVSGVSKTNKSDNTQPTVTNFQDAVKAAKAKLAK